MYESSHYVPIEPLLCKYGLLSKSVVRKWLLMNLFAWKLSIEKLQMKFDLALSSCNVIDLS